MRVKNDTIIKWSNLAATMYLTNEEFGALIRNVMIEDDKDNLHHQFVPEVALKFLKEKEEEWINDYSELNNKNPQLTQAFITVFGQVNHSHRAFDKLQEKYDVEDIENIKNKKSKNTKIDNLHNFNIFGIPFSFEYSSDVDFTNEQLENEFSDIKEFLEFDEVMFINIVNDTFAIASSDNFKKTIKEYCSAIKEGI